MIFNCTLSYSHNIPSAFEEIHNESYYYPIELSESQFTHDLKEIKKDYPNALIVVQIHWNIAPQYNFTLPSSYKAPKLAG